MTSSGQSARRRPADAIGGPPSAPGRRRPPRWLIVAVVAFGAGVGGFLAALPFWRRPEPSRPAEDGVATLFVEDSFEGPAFSPEATTDDFKQEAIRTAERLLEAFPSSAESLGVAARLQFAMGRSEEATRMWRRCLELDPGFAGAHFGLGLAAKNRGDLPEAISMFQKVMVLEPDEPRAPPYLAEALLKSGRAEEAAVLLDGHVHTQMPSVEAVVQLGQVYLHLEEYEKARQTFQTLIESDPTEMRAYWGLGRVFAKLGQRDEARQYLEKFRSLESADQQSLVREVRTYVDTPVVRGVLIQALVESGQVYRNHGSLAEAERVWRKAAFLETKNAQCRRNLLSMYEEQNRDHDALRICEELCGIEPENPDHWLNVGLLNGRLQRVDEALEALEKAIQIDPHDPRYRQAYDLFQGGR